MPHGVKLTAAHRLYDFNMVARFKPVACVQAFRHDAAVYFYGIALLLKAERFRQGTDAQVFFNKAQLAIKL